MKAMTLPRWIVLPLLLLFAAQWTVPLSQVYQEEKVRREGAVFRLALQPVDPYDVMRGRYLALSFAPPETPLSAPQGSQVGDTVYAVLQKGENGLAQIVRLSANAEDHAFATTLYYRYNYEEGATTNEVVTVDIPLTRFYLPEDDAIALDQILAQQAVNAGADANNGRVQAALDVRVMNGRIVADSLWLDGRPYREWLLDYLVKQTP